MCCKGTVYSYQQSVHSVECVLCPPPVPEQVGEGCGSPGYPGVLHQHPHCQGGEGSVHSGAAGEQSIVANTAAFVSLISSNILTF